MNILVINAGSSSMKYQLIDMVNERVMAKGMIEWTGGEKAVLTHEAQGKERYIADIEVPDYALAVKKVLDALLDKDHGAIGDIAEIGAVGHRIVHGGEGFSDSVLIDDTVMGTLGESIELAPLHNPANIMAIEACRRYMPSVKMAGVFDTAFYQTMPPKAFLYAIPMEAYTKYKIRRYGFHGCSHQYVSSYAAEKMAKDLSELRMITCHLGNGSSITAIDHGRAVDTSMGFTPLEGLAMGTRSGDIDPTVVQYLIHKTDMTLDEAIEYLNKQSGVLGISGVSSDFRNIFSAADRGDERAKLAIDIYCYRVKKYIGAYVAAMGGADAIVFTAGIGENAPRIRKMIMDGMDYLNVWLDEEKNNAQEEIISGEESAITIMAVHTNEELMIARETQALCETSISEGNN